MPGPYFVGARFFTGFPNWRHASIHVRKRGRVFFVDVSMPRWVEPTSEERTRLLGWLSRASVDPPLWERELREARIKELLFDDGSIVTSFGGIVSDPARLQRAVDLLRRLAG